MALPSTICRLTYKLMDNKLLKWRTLQLFGQPLHPSALHTWCTLTQCCLFTVAARRIHVLLHIYLELISDRNSIQFLWMHIHTHTQIHIYLLIHTFKSMNTFICAARTICCIALHYFSCVSLITVVVAVLITVIVVVFVTPANMPWQKFISNTVELLQFQLVKWIDICSQRSQSK